MTSISRSVRLSVPDPAWTGADLVEIGNGLLGQPVSQIFIKNQQTDSLQLWDVTQDGLRGPSGELVNPRFPMNLRPHMVVEFVGFGFAKFTKLPAFGIWLIEEEKLCISGNEAIATDGKRQQDQD